MQIPSEQPEKPESQPAPTPQVDEQSTNASTGEGDEVAPAEDIQGESAPLQTSASISVIGIGGSAGAIEVLRDFFQLMPADSGMAFVVVLHLSPGHESTLSQLLQNSTSMRVIQVTQVEKIEPNTVYVIPPNAHLSMRGNQICLMPLNQPHGKRVAVDLFFRSLADTYGQSAIGIILSGADGDGSIGLKRIKEHGGLTIAQEPTEALHDSMPRSAIATGMVDWILPVAHMPSKLLSHQQNEKRLRLPAESLKSSKESREDKNKPTAQADETALREVFSLLRARSGHDFTHYKRATVLRRISRRLQVNSLTDIPGYLDYLRSNPGEAGALLHDLLISVTNFFRDPQSFEALAEVVPRLFKDKTSNDQVRVWVAGCATGEEAYSIAILLAEYASKLDSAPSILIFATDLSDEAIQTAREGKYPETITADVSPERLQRYFTLESGYYRIRKEIRESVLFAVHNLIKDSPFSRLDLISCRNLLIYLNRQAQRRVFETFHFALLPKGILFLGTSESAEDQENLFTSHNKKHRLYIRDDTTQRIMPQFPLSDTPPVRPLAGRNSFRSTGAPKFANLNDQTTYPPEVGLGAGRRSNEFSALHLKLLERFAPPSIVINEEYEILHLSENAGRYLVHTGGQISSNLLKVIHPSLRLELSAALFSAIQRKEDVHALAVLIESDSEDKIKYINLQVHPAFQADEAAKGLILVMFEELNEAPDLSTTLTTAEPLSQHLHEEIQRLKTSLHSTVEQYEASVEELKASNEELQAMNEEARSSTEELETGKEELQSVNEELITVNSELKSNVEDLARANSDMQNLMVSSEIATIFLDRGFLIKRYTPRAAQIFNLIPTDTERPISHITHRLEYPELATDVEQILTELNVIEREVKTTDGYWFLVRLLPYRTEGNYTDGVILTLIDITPRKEIEADLLLRREELRSVNEIVRQSEEKYRTLFNTIREAFSVVEVQFDANSRPFDCLFLESNPAFERLTGLKNVEGKTIRETMPGIDTQWIEEFGAVALTGQSHSFSKPVAELGNRWYEGYAFQIGDRASHRIALIFSEITDRKRAELNAAFLASVASNLTLFTTIDEMMQAVGAIVGTYLELSACAFLEINDTIDAASPVFDWHRADAERLIDTNRISGLLTQEFKQASSNGECFVVADTATDSRVPSEEYAAINVAAFVNVPIVTDGKWHFSFAVFDSEPHDWRDDEIELIRELATRIWVGIIRRRSEETLRESEERLRLSIAASNAFTWEINVRTHQSRHSSNVRDVLGFELPTDTREILSLIHPDDRNNVLREATNAMHDKEQLDVEHRIISPVNGDVIWVRVQGVFIQKEATHSSRFLGITQNITDRKKMAEALSSSEERYRIFIESIEDYAIFMADLDAKITSWNSGVERVLGYSEEEFIGQPAAIIFTPEDRAAGMHELELETARLTGRAPDERWHVRKDGTRFYASGVMTALRNEKGNIHGYAKILRDMTDRKRMEDELEAIVQERTQKLRDVNNELSIESTQRLELERTRLQLLERIVSTQEEERHRISRELHDQMGQQLTALLLGLKSLPSVLDEQAVADAMPRLTSLQEITNGLMDQVHHLAWELRPAALDNLGLEAAIRQYAKQWSADNGIDIDFISRGFAHDKRLSPLIETTLYRIIQESLTNVQRHAQAQHVSILLERIHNEVVAIIEDDGKGFNLQNDADKKAGGHGTQRLGLIGMRERIELVGGTLTIESEGTEGTAIFARVWVNQNSDTVEPNENAFEEPTPDNI